MSDQQSKKERWQNAGLIILTIFIAIGMIWWNTYRRSVTYFNEGEKLFQEGQLLDAITSFETSAHAYTPYNSYVKRSMERMWEIGTRFEAEKEEPDYALIAYRSLRSSVYAIRSLYMPYKEWIPRCDEKIRKLVEIQKSRIEAAKIQPAPLATP
jgi:hypothetical protein